MPYVSGDHSDFDVRLFALHVMVSRSYDRPKLRKLLHITKDLEF